MKSTQFLGEKLALQRTELANQRTILAYIKIAIYFSAMAFTIGKVLDSRTLIIELSLYTFSLLFLTLGLISYISNQKGILKEKQNLHILESTEKKD